jgi:hypothetical protein
MNVEMPETIESAIFEQQEAVGRLRSLVELAQVALRDHSDELEEPAEGLAGLKEMADRIWAALDWDAILKRADQIETARREDRERALRVSRC